MAEVQKTTVEVPEVAVDAAAPAAAVEEAVAPETTPAADDKSADEPVAVADDAKSAENKDETTPVEEGHLAHKAQGASFPKNLIPSKQFFFFGSDAVDAKSLAHYLKAEKSLEAAHSNIAWAAHTGKGLLFIGDKKAPTGLINLADATEPEVDGSNKFHFTSKGSKHSFKAASAAERDGWVAQLKLKIAEAKELAVAVSESDMYKNTIESFKPAIAVAKEEKPAEEAPKPEEPAATEATTGEAEAAKEELKAEEPPKRRSASRKRASFFGFGKKEEKKEDAKAEDVATPEPSEPAAEAEAAKPEETSVAAEAPAAAAENKPAEERAAEDKPVEEAAAAESPKEKPMVSKRNSFFGTVFSKKEKKAIDATQTAEETRESATEGDNVIVDATAPVIPPVESTAPLAVDVASPSAAPAETVESSAPNSESKKDVKEKRKSSLAFAFGKRDKSPAPVDGEEKPAKSAFSKLRATIKGKSAAKAEDKAADDSVTEAAEEAPASETAAATEAAAEETSKAAEPEVENKTENVAAAAPVVTAAA
ncbi:Pleckstrin domain-like protein [Drechmeria coniospora]|uniref:Pleckstrin domain-like protein n=1 Tax=Drechmeria coniospora TaxID=98403 RepID=A0A151GC60_DRECN|nr:Pleckstrin domain-like protein [Drechmeria coniospora]KYK54698.1 Pleckstrin domain-like protein [Drechmeria coniospora]